MRLEKINEIKHQVDYNLHKIKASDKVALNVQAISIPLKMIHYYAHACRHNTKYNMATVRWQEIVLQLAIQYQEATRIVWLSKDMEVVAHKK